MRQTIREREREREMEWFLLKKLAGLVRVYSLRIINRNHSNTFLLIDPQKTKTCPK